jgi:hypothetical protein
LAHEVARAAMAAGAAAHIWKLDDIAGLLL